MAIQLGDEAPDFELRDQNGQPVKLSDFRGQRNVVLVFYPFSFTRRCEGELCSLRDEIETFQNDEVVTLAVSCDSVGVQNARATERGFQFPVLSDYWPHGEVSRQYGVFNETFGFSERGTFIIDKDGEVIYTTVTSIGEARDADEYVRALQAIGAAGTAPA